MPGRHGFMIPFLICFFLKQLTYKSGKFKPNNVSGKVEVKNLRPLHRGVFYQ